MRRKLREIEQIQEAVDAGARIDRLQLLKLQRKPAVLAEEEELRVHIDAVQMAEERGCALTDLSLTDLQSLHELFTDDVTTRARRAPKPRGRRAPHAARHRTPRPRRGQPSCLSLARPGGRSVARCGPWRSAAAPASFPRSTA